MSNGYDKYFKAAKNKSAGKKSGKKSPAPATSKGVSAEEYLRQALNVKSKVKKPAGIPWASLAVVIIGLGGSVFGYMHPEKVTGLVEKVEITFLGSAIAADPTKGPENSAATNGQSQEASAASGETAKTENCPANRGYTEEELSHFNKLNERKKELDLREADLTALEEELHKQKQEIEARIVKLEQIRGEVASTLKERVEIDEQRVGTLVDFYSNMKPKQAAEIFGKLNEDLAVEILGKMKKKNAAEILNLLEPAKARVLSEKFTGYKRR